MNGNLAECDFVRNAAVDILVPSIVLEMKVDFIL